jgi:DNA end-binding protein Ku
VPDLKIKGEMLELAEHIIKTKSGKFNPKDYDDRYEAALAEVVKAKMEGRKIDVRKEPRQDKVVDLMAALRESAGLVGKKKTASRKTANSKATAAKAKVTPTRRKAS